MNKRKETDSLGSLEIEQDKYYGAQTARSLKYFSWGNEVVPMMVIKALAIIKKGAALVNKELGLLPEPISNVITEVSNEIIKGKLNDHFPLKIWQTGSGTQSNMNVNEVIANRSIEKLGGTLGSKSPVHPNDHVNLSQSSNDVFPTAMHIAAVLEIKNNLIKAIDVLRNSLKNKVREFSSILKIGRTHLMDAVPMTLGQEFSGYVDHLDKALERIGFVLPHLYELAIGATAVGTGINVPKGFVDKMLIFLKKETEQPFVRPSNYFSSISCHDALIFAHSAIKTLACSLFKIATDLSFLGSGPRCGLGELIFSQNEPGSSIMPGKVNPTQCEALIMVCCQVYGNDNAISLGGSRGNFELNVLKPMIINNFLNSCEILKDGMISFSKNFIDGLQPNKEKINYYLNNSLMLVTALSPKIGYDKASKLALKAYKENISLKQASISLGFFSEEEFDELVKPENMIGTN